MFQLTILCATLADLDALRVKLGTPALETPKAETPKAETPKAKKPKAEAPADDGLNLGGAATDSLDDLLSGGDAAPAGPTEDDMKDKLREVLANPKFGKDYVTKILAKHGATKVGDVAAEDRAKVMATCDAVLKK